MQRFNKSNKKFKIIIWGCLGLLLFLSVFIPACIGYAEGIAGRGFSRISIASENVDEVENVESPIVFLLEIDGEIKAGTLQYLRRGFRLAEEQGAEWIIIKLETPGGLVGATKDIVDLIIGTEIETVVFVHRKAGWAYSAGTFILLAANYAIVHPEASIGAAQPVALVGGEAAAEKAVEGIVSWIRTIAEANQRDAQIAEKFVRENLTLSGREAKEIGIIDETARDLEELFLKLNIFQPQVKEVALTFIEKLFNFLSHPYLVSLFLTIGVLGIIFAIRTGEFEITGIVSIIVFSIGLWGMGIIDFNILGIVLIGLGIIFVAIELFVEPGFGVLGIGGIVALALGIFTFEGEPFLAPGLFDAVTLFVIGAGIAFCLFFIIIGRGAARSLKIKPKTGIESLIGIEAEVIENLKPIGQVKINGQIWRAQSLDKETILKQSKVKVIKAEGNTLYVTAN